MDVLPVFFPLGVENLVSGYRAVKGKGLEAAFIGVPSGKAESRTAGQGLRPQRVVVVQHFLRFVCGRDAAVGEKVQNSNNFIPFSVDDCCIANDGAGKVKGRDAGFIREPAAEGIPRADGVAEGPDNGTVGAGLQQDLVAVGFRAAQVDHGGNFGQRGNFYSRGAKTGNGGKHRNQSGQGDAQAERRTSVIIHRNTSVMAA